MNRVIIYGDIHGCFDEFKMLRDELQITPKDTEILVGDLLDRGPYSNEVLTYARKNNLQLVLGNHEYKYIRYYKHNLAEKQTGKKNPMHFNEDKLAIYNNITDVDMRYLMNAPFFLKIDNITVVHAGITNKIDLDNPSKKELELLTRIRKLDSEEKPLPLGQESFHSQYWADCYDGNQGIIVYGHEVHNLDKIKINRHAFGIDTGCVYGGKLTALIIYDTKEPMYSYDILQVQAFEKYANSKDVARNN